jgi:hypothetical protein
MEKQAGFSKPKPRPRSSNPKSRRAPRDDPIERFAELQLTLTDLLGPLDDEPRRLDASSKDVHDLVGDIYGIVKQKVFGRGGLLDISLYKDSYDEFEEAHAQENDMYEVYADDLERYERRRTQNLSVAESDSDRLALVKRRRVYIPTLLEFSKQASAINQYLRERPSSA